MPRQTTRVAVAHQKCLEPKLLVRDGRVILLLRVPLDHLHGVKRRWSRVEVGARPSAESERGRGPTVSAPIFNPLKPPRKDEVNRKSAPEKKKKRSW